jgi:MFS family permease
MIATPLLLPLEERQSTELSNPISHIFIKAKEILGNGVSASLQDGQIVLGYFASFLARSDSISINLFLPIWIFKFYVSKGECVDTNPGDLIKSSCHQAYTDASILSGVTQLFSLLGAPFVGYFLDKYDRKVIVLISSCLASLGYILTSQVSNPSSKVNIIYLGLVGLGEIGLIVSAVALVSHSGIPQEARGLISGISSFSGALGVLITSKIGGILFDISSGWPFLFLGLLHLVFIIVTSIYLAWTRFL